MSKNLVEVILDFLLTGGVTAVIVGVAIVLARKEDAEVRLQQAAELFSPFDGPADSSRSRDVLQIRIAEPFPDGPNGLLFEFCLSPD